MNSNVENFLSGTDHFEKISVVPSRLCRGDREAIPNPYITIAIPTYRRNDLLKWSMESALAQENPGCEYEVVVVDNEGSSSETATGAVVRSFQDGRLLYYKNQKNLGMFGNFNRCIELARGEWVAFLHDDDMLRPTYLRDVCQLLKRKKHIGGIVADTIDIDNSLSVGDQREAVKVGFKGFIRRLEEKKLMRLTTRDSQILGNIYGAPTCGNIFRRDYLLAVGGFDQALFPSADYFFLHAFNDAFRIYRTKTYFGYYRWLDNESLKPSTLEAFITQTEALREVLAKETLLGRVLDKLFRNERHFQLQRGVKTLDKDSRVDFDALSRSLGYTFHPFKYRVFIVLRYGYWYARRVLTILFS